ncbi:AraC family transcriptional regulator [Niveibacterium sp. SC-1]|uniref:AraC family transcriptional regulator n=1 Tax=Niveibacterium sp. SC-1 TaxID=3135646 RepID=UPI00311FE277
MPVAHELVRYYDRVNRAIDHVEAHLDDTLSLAGAARIACFAPTHFHKVFGAVAGARFGDYLRARRLERAAGLLLNEPSSSVLDVAVACGFASGEALSRAFRRHFGCPPSAWRDGGHVAYRRAVLRQHLDVRTAVRPLWATSAWMADETRERTFATGIGMPLGIGRFALPGERIRLERRPAQRIAYCRLSGPYGLHVRVLWQRLRAWCEALGRDMRERSCIATWLDNPSLTPAANCRHEVGLLLEEGEAAPEGLVERSVPGGVHVVCTLDGTVAEASLAWRWLLTEWLPANGLAPTTARPYEQVRVADNPCFVDAGDLHVRGLLCIPVRPR